MRRLSLVLVTLGTVLSFAPLMGLGGTGDTVVVVPIHGTIDSGMEHLVQRAVSEAADEHAKAILLDVNTFGGLVDAATNIRYALYASRIPVDAYVSERAWSAGALVTLAAQKIVMAPGSSIGAAEPIPKTPKTVSALRAEFRATAERAHRDPNIAGGMVDANVSVPPYKKPGAILSLTANDAVRAHFADGVALTQGDALGKLGLGSATVITPQYTFGERLARFATNPEVSGMLLSLGFLGFLIELQTLHGIAGAIGAAALALFFGSHVYAGFSNFLVVILGIAGIILIMLELHVFPGHGFSGIAGALALIGAVFLAFGGIPFVFVTAQALAIAIVLSALAFWGASRIFPESAWLRRIVFAAEQGPDYVASSDYRALLGKSGIATSYLRPAGVAAIDGRRVAVLTEGDFVQEGTAVTVTRVEGARIFVRPAIEVEAKETA
ncbi:MAG: ATP-dependent Clp protease proteolytic subunit [Candidatus Eremiobacteraeota bacterium]|nr:ATP-dependent Clp protease proteolytic subunit [Candidatus Eremiobacteraeota bacterium]